MDCFHKLLRKIDRRFKTATDLGPKPETTKLNLGEIGKVKTAIRVTEMKSTRDGDWESKDEKSGAGAGRGSEVVGTRATIWIEEAGALEKATWSNL